MASWSDVSLAAPAFAAAVRAILDAHKHKILATLRKDGSPRISGIEVDFVDGELWLGAMWQSRKALDLQRDPRFALHSATADDGEAWRGDAKIAGWVEEVIDPERKRTVQAASGGGAPPGPFHLFRAEVTEVVLVRVGAPRTTWSSNPGTKGGGCNKSRGDRQQRRRFTWRECNEPRFRSSWSTSGR